MMEILGYLAATITGLTLGLLGAGGSILAVPIIVYLFKTPAASATYHSLFVVGTIAAVGVIPFAQRGLVKAKVAFLFFLPAVIGVLFSRKVILPSLPSEIHFFGLSASKDLIILVAFGVVMMVAAGSMLRSGPARENLEPKSSHWLRTSFIGISVGVITGFVGAGGGFLIVPALTRGLGLSIQTAVGTSLMIIALNSLSGFSSDWLSGATPDWILIVKFLVPALLGLWVGTRLNQKIPSRKLKPAFGWFVLVLGFSILVRQVMDLV